MPCLAPTWMLLALVAAQPAAEPAAQPAASPPPAASQPWLLRHAPTRHMLELGVAFGALFPSPHHKLIDGQILGESEGMFYQRYSPFVVEYALRAAYFPLAVLGVEVEGNLAPTYTRELKERANLMALRGQLVAHLVRRSATPYFVAGGGMLSTHGALGTDRDGAVHFGVGGKVWVNDRLVVRLELRDTVSSGIGRTAAHFIQVSIGLSLRIDLRRRVTAR